MTDTVRDAVVPAVILDPGTSVKDARARLEQAGAAFLVLRDEHGGLQGPLSAEASEQAEEQDPNTPLRRVAADVPPPIIVQPQMSVDQVTRMVAKDLVLNPRRAGVIVQEGDRLLGVLPRSFLVQRASRLVTRGTADRPEGPPLDILYFECPEDGERQLVPYYDPRNPPTCSQGHRMRPVED